MEDRYVVEIRKTKGFSEVNDAVAYAKALKESLVYQVVFDNETEAANFIINITKMWQNTHPNFTSAMEHNIAVILRGHDTTDEDGIYALSIRDSNDVEMEEENIYIPLIEIDADSEEIVVKNILTTVLLEKAMGFTEDINFVFEKSDHNCIGVTVMDKGKWICTLPLNLPVFEFDITLPITSRNYGALVKMFRDVKHILRQDEAEGL